MASCAGLLPGRKGEIVTDDLRYPIGPFVARDLTPELIADCIAAIRECPGRLRDALEDLGEAQLDTPYRPDGWTVRQVTHHLVDSHVNAWCRMRLVMTEDHPTIRVYDQEAWAGLDDARSAPVDLSLTILDGLHARWVRLLESLPAESWGRLFEHPEAGSQNLGWLLQQYGWHSRHHVAHITHLRERQGW